VKSKNNVIVRQIEQNSLLTEEDKEKLLHVHETQLNAIDSILDIERRKQENELDRALKERLDKRHRIKEKKSGRQMREEQRQVD
jgi:ribosomal protein L14E/L6E/L27E